MSSIPLTIEALQQLVAERKAEKQEKARQKRLEDLRIIESDLKSKKEFKPLEKLTKDAWERIFDEVKDPLDLATVERVNGLFRDILETRRNRDILLPQMMDKKFSCFWRKYCFDTWIHDLGFMKCTYDKHRPLAQYISMRSVSKSLRDAVDLWNEQNLLDHLNGMGVLNSVPTISISPFELEEEEGTLSRLLASFTGPEAARRFSLRSLKVSFSRKRFESKAPFVDEAMNDFIANVTSLLDMIGGQIWRFEVNICHESNCPLEGQETILKYYKWFCVWVMRMPNLKWLKLNLRFRLAKDDSGSRCFTPASIPIFPVLKSLHRLDIEYDNVDFQFQIDFLNAVTNANPHVKILKLKPCRETNFLSEEMISWLQSTPLSLETIQLVRVSNLSLFESILKPDWQLEKVHLHLQEEIESINPLFRILEKFQTLKQLALHISSERAEIYDDVTYLMLPNLTDFKLIFRAELDPEINSGLFWSLLFLVHSKLLKRLHWENEMRMSFGKVKELRDLVKGRDDEMLQYSGGLRNLRSSNIWAVFPYLEKLNVNLQEGPRNPLHNFPLPKYFCSSYKRE